MENAVLVLEDGFTLRGKVFARGREVCGEVVFNTAMTGYQEVITDPSYCQQIVTMTYPLIGNYGVNAKDCESDRPQLQALLVREYCSSPSSWRSEKSLGTYLEEHAVLGIEDIDTRALTRHIRRDGAMKGALSVGTSEPDQLREQARDHPDLAGRNLTSRVTCSQSYRWNDSGRYHVVVIDYGVKYSILRRLAESGLMVTVVPAETEAAEICARKPDGILLSNGPGDPAAVPIKQVKHLLGKFPIFGICFGHQVLARALGLETFKLKFGHRGGNHPVKNLESGRVEITTQNHGFCVKRPETMQKFPSGLEFTHINLNDQTLEGMRCPDLKCFSVQYHPEAAPGPHDSHYLFQEFVELIERA